MSGYDEKEIMSFGEISAKIEKCIYKMDKPECDYKNTRNMQNSRNGVTQQYITKQTKGRR
jgi:hypothetical protein